MDPLQDSLPPDGNKTTENPVGDRYIDQAKEAATVILLALFGVVALALIFALCYWRFRKQRSRPKTPSRGGGDAKHVRELMYEEIGIDESAEIERQVESKPSLTSIASVINYGDANEKEDSSQKTKDTGISDSDTAAPSTTLVKAADPRSPGMSTPENKLGQRFDQAQIDKGKEIHQIHCSRKQDKTVHGTKQTGPVSPLDVSKLPEQSSNSTVGSNEIQPSGHTATDKSRCSMRKLEETATGPVHSAAALR